MLQRAEAHAGLGGACNMNVCAVVFESMLSPHKLPNLFVAGVAENEGG